MTDIIVRQPSNNVITAGFAESSMSENQQYSSDIANLPITNQETNPHSGAAEPVLTGLGPLRNATHLTIKQRIRACELLSLCTGCEVRVLRYVV